jgi:hypothetical protein
MCLSQGITTQSLGHCETKDILKESVQSSSGDITRTDLEKAIVTPAIVPPRREIGESNKNTS